MLGYEVLNDHLRKGSDVNGVGGQAEPGAWRTDCEALAGERTLNRLKRTPKRNEALQVPTLTWAGRQS